MTQVITHKVVFHSWFFHIDRVVEVMAALYASNNTVLLYISPLKHLCCTKWHTISFRMDVNIRNVSSFVLSIGGT